MSITRLALVLAAAIAVAAAPRARAQSKNDVPLPPPPAGMGRVAASSPPAAGRAPGWLGLSAGPFAAFERGQSLGLVLDYGFEATPPGWTRWQLEWHLAFVVSRPTEDTPLFRLESTSGIPGFPGTGTSAVIVPAGVEQSTVLLAAIVPTARLRLPVAPGFALVLDGGLGVVQSVEQYERDEMFVGRTERTKNVTGLALRLGAGVTVDFSQRLRLVFEPIAFSILMGPEHSGFTPTLGLAYRL